MTLRGTLQQNPHLGVGWRDGLQALEPNDRVRIKAEPPKRLRGSAAVDSDLRSRYPNDHRWDYVIAFQHSNRPQNQENAYWVEVHSAHDHGATEVLRKAQWLRDWLNGAGASLRFPPGRFDLVWIASGRISLTKTSQRARALAQMGIAFPCRRLALTAVKAG